MATMLVLTAINFLNYIDRYVLAAVLDGVGTSFALTDAQGGLLTSMFVVVYMLASPVTGVWGDRVTRKYMVAVGVALWSVATIGSGLARSYEEMLVMRGLVGVGEAGYAAVAPAMIADLFEEKRRGRALAWFYAAIPMGSAIGFGLGGAVAEHSQVVLGWVGLAELDLEGWRVALCVAGGPGLVMAAFALVMREPQRGAADGEHYAASGNGSVRENLATLFRSPAWRIDTVGMTLMTFAMGGIAAWMPTYLQRAHAMSEGQAGMVFGGITVVAGLLATIVGGQLGDRAFARAPGGYFRVSAWGLLLGAPVVLALPFVGVLPVVLVMAFVAEFCLFLNTGPLNAALVACVGPTLRATAVAVNVLFIHLLGDAISPLMMGAISDALGGGGRGLGIAIGATAIPLVAGAWVLLRGASRVDAAPQGLRQLDASAG